MALDDAFMLPKRVRTMAQMADLLQVERLMLDRLYAVIQEMLAQSTINNNVTVTKEFLEQVSSFFANNPCRVDEYPSEDTIHIVVDRNGDKPTSVERLIAGIDVLIPAHLRYCIVFELAVNVDNGRVAAGAAMAGSYMRVEADIQARGSIDFPQATAETGIGAAMAGQYQRIETEVLINGVE